MVKNIWKSNGQPSPVTLLFEYLTPKIVQSVDTGLNNFVSVEVGWPEWNETE